MVIHGEGELNHQFPLIELPNHQLIKHLALFV